MTEPEQPVESQEPTATTPKTRAGRPRPQETIERDAKVLAVLEESKDENGAYVGVSRKELEEKTSLPSNQVYLSIYRLRTTAQIEKVTGNKWSVKTVDAPAEPVAV